jgi:prevent-host-death family protein
MFIRILQFPEAVMTIHASIGQVKRDISELVNRVAYSGERVILTSRGRPKAVLIGLEDYERLRRAEQTTAGLQDWLAGVQALSGQILERRGNRPVEVDELLRQSREDLERRHAWPDRGD